MEKKQAKGEPGFKVFPITDEQTAFLANPSHKACHGLGYVGTMQVQGQARRVLCSCVHRALAAEGRVPWVERKERQGQTAPAVDAEQLVRTMGDQLDLVKAEVQKPTEDERK